MWYFEQNYRLLKRLLNRTDLLLNQHVELQMSSERINLEIVEQTPYTLLLKIRQSLRAMKKMIPDLVFEVRVYTDAQLAEVVSYQGVRRLQPKYEYPNQAMHLPDEKRQSNLVLHDWLCSYSRLEFSETLIKRV